MWGLPWGLGVHGDHRALKKKRQGDLLGSARHGLTEAINPSPRGPRDPRTWEGEIPVEKGIRDCSGSRQGRVEPCAGVNCSAPALPAAPEGRPRREATKRNWRRRRRCGSADRGRRGGDQKKKKEKKKTHLASTRGRGARGARHDDGARALCRAPAPAPCMDSISINRGGVVYGASPLVLEVESHGGRRRRAARGARRGGQSVRSDSTGGSYRPARSCPAARSGLRGSEDDDGEL